MNWAPKAGDMVCARRAIDAESGQVPAGATGYVIRACSTSVALCEFPGIPGEFLAAATELEFVLEREAA